MSRGVARLADVERNVEEQCFGDAPVGAGNGDERFAIATRKVGGVDVSDRALQLEALSQQITRGGKHTGVDGLFGFIIGELQSDRVG